jgi:hypothetical protein
MPLTDFDLGQLSAKVKELEHRLRNVHQISNDLADAVEETRIQLARLRVEIRTAVSVVVAIATALAFLLK